MPNVTSLWSRVPPSPEQLVMQSYKMVNYAVIFSKSFQDFIVQCWSKDYTSDSKVLPTGGERKVPRNANPPPAPAVYLKHKTCCSTP